MCEKAKNMYELVLQERRFFCFWIILHLVCMVSLLVGLLFGYLYMKMPDRVIVLARDNTVYLGNSAPLDAGRVIEDVALRATYALLSRRYDVEDNRAISFTFTKRGQGQAADRLHGIKLGGMRKNDGQHTGTLEHVEHADGAGGAGLGSFHGGSFLARDIPSEPDAAQCVDFE